MGSVGQRAAKLPAIKLWEWFDPGPTRTRAEWFEWGQAADFFLRTTNLTANNFAVLWSIDPKFLALKDLNLLKKHTKNQEASSILRLVFTLSKWPHLHREWPKKRYFSQCQGLHLKRNFTVNRFKGHLSRLVVKYLLCFYYFLIENSFQKTFLS